MKKKILITIVCIVGITITGLLVLMGIAARFDGYWCFDAYGMLLKSRFGFVKAYQVTDSTAVRVVDYDGFILGDKLIFGLGMLKLDKQGDALNLIDNGSQTVYSSKKVEKSFLEAKKMVSEDPRDQLLLFYESLKENYAFTELYDVDFDAAYRLYSGLIDENTQDETLFQFMSAMLDPLKDDHVYLEAGDRYYSPYINPSEFWRDTAKVQELVDLIKAKYLKDYIKFKDSPVRYATLNDDTGYIVLSGMGTETLDQARTTKKAFNRIIKEFQDRKTIVIDIRFNGGGFDAASLAINGYFTQTPYLAYQKQAFYKGGYTEPQSIYVQPNDLYYEGDIILLTSKYTVSAAENFARTLVANPSGKVMVVGEGTKGFYSDCIPRKIKKGWYFGLSNERYLSGDGNLFEGTCVEPDVAIPVQYSDVQKGIDPALEWILNGCRDIPQEKADTPTPEPKNPMEIQVWDYSDGLLRSIEKYRELHPDCPYTFKLQSFATADVWYQGYLRDTLANGGECVPDIFAVESTFVSDYTKREYCQYVLPYKDLGVNVDELIQTAEIPQYAIDWGTNSDGELVALGWQSTGSAFIYRRSIALDVWGTDDPAAIGRKIGPGWEKFFMAAEEQKSKGYSIVSGTDTLWMAVSNTAEKGWVIDGKLYMDPARVAYLDNAKKLADSGYSNNTRMWIDEWFQEMQGKGKKPVFGFMGPSWMVNYVIQPNSGGQKPGEGTYGDWAVCLPPAGYAWGGDIVMVNKATKHREIIGDVLEWLTLDSSESGYQSLYASGEGLDNGVMGTVLSRAVMRKLDGSLDFLAGQNMYDVFIPATDMVNGKLFSEFDLSFDNLWLEQVRLYVEGKITKEEAVDNFKNKIKDGNYGIAVE
jgi:hypothetical protein